MPEILLHIFDYFFLLFHLGVILINVFGWLFVKTRRLQVIILFTTLFSWVALGFIYGWGYCFLTDWHWDILTQLDSRPIESSYVQYLFLRVLNVSVSAKFSNLITLVGLCFGMIGAVGIRLYNRNQ